MKFVITVCVFFAVAAAESFLGAPSSASLNDRDLAFREAASTVMGCGSGIGRDRLSGIEKVLTPMWRALQKNQWDRVEWRMLRYVTHRYFMKRSSLLIRGFEPTRRVNESDLGDIGVLSKQAPSLVEMIFEGKEQTKGFSLEDAVTFIATLEQVIFDSESGLLETAYRQQRKPLDEDLSHSELSDVVESYLVHWLAEGDTSTARILLRNRTLLGQALPNWDALNHFANGMVKSLEFSRQRAPQSGHARAAMTHRYAFDDAHQAVGSITNSFASFWEAQCQDIKTSLIAFDKTSTGRISLSDFYGANADGEWRFGESEQYLRELGALDESSSWRGPQVIISNYLLGASNCIVTAPHYLICCVNECEHIIHEIEDTVRAPIARPDKILSIVMNMSSFEDEPPRIDRALKSQLHRLAETHGGKVPLHGRLFNQWLHYVFPRECPFPHKTGAASSASVSEFGGASFASKEEIRTYAGTRTNISSTQIDSVSAEQWMSQWSEEEELLTDYDLRAPWEGSHRVAFGSVALMLFALGGLYSLKGTTSKTSAAIGASIFDHKTHFV